MNTTILILVIPILVAIIAASIWVLHSKCFSGETFSLVAALAILLSVIVVPFLTMASPELKEGRVYVQCHSTEQRHEVIEIEGSRYLRGPFGTITPYIKPGKE